MSKVLLRCQGGALRLPDADLVLVDADDGGNLIVDPPRPVWDRSELAPAELARWSFLVAAAARAMLDCLPALEGGCINYWDAGNWSLNHEAQPRGPKNGPEHRRVHLHLLGRARAAASPDLRWGEAPRFPDFAQRHAWARRHRRLGADACAAVVARTTDLLLGRFGVGRDDVELAGRCPECRYPVPAPHPAAVSCCSECAP